MAIIDDFQNLFDTYVAHYRIKDALGCASVFSSQAEMYSPYGPPAIGRAAIETTHREWVELGGENKILKVIGAGCSGDLGWCLARFSEGTTGNGISLNILERQTDGIWLITHCSLNEAP